MANNLTLADKIVDALHSGKVPAELTALDGIVDGSTIANGTTVANITVAEEAHDVNSTFSDTEVEAALDALGAKINEIIAALEAFKIAAEA